DPSFKPRVRYTCRMSIWAPACTDVGTKASCELSPFWICGANPKWMPRFIPASLPFASNVAKVGSSPVRMLELAALPAVVFSFVKLQNTYVPRERERPTIRHLHRQALRPGRRGDAERETQQQQRETLHTRTPPWELAC